MQQEKSSFNHILLIGVLFFIFGFVTWINGTLIPYLKIACELETDMQSYLVATAFFIAYAVMSIPSSYVLKFTGYKKGMALGLLIMAVGAILFVPAANARNYNLFLTGLFIIGSGLALLQTASNPYVTIVGPIESAASRISVMGICNKVGGILAGLIFGYIALKDADKLEKSLLTMTDAARDIALNELAGRVIIPYIIIATALFGLAIFVMRSSLPEIDDSAEEANEHNTVTTNKTSVLQYPNLVLGVIALFLYVGVEVLAGEIIISYGKSLNIDLDIARYFSQATLGCMLVGYLIGIATIPKYLSQTNALKICAILGVIFTVAATLTSAYVSVAFVILLGLANSLIWPAVWPLAINGLGKFTKIGSGLLVTAIAGGAILPVIYGKLADNPAIGNKQAYWIMVPCYLFILLYAMRGKRLAK